MSLKTVTFAIPTSAADTAERQPEPRLPPRQTDFRFMWASTKLEEDPRLSTAGRMNPFPFCNIPCEEATPAALAAAAPQMAAADGLLFYHRRAHYRPRVTPLVLWLKPFMLPETVGVGLTPAQLGAPEDYTNMADYIAAFEARRKNRNTEKRGKEGKPTEEVSGAFVTWLWFRWALWG